MNTWSTYYHPKPSLNDLLFVEKGIEPPFGIELFMSEAASMIDARLRPLAEDREAFNKEFKRISSEIQKGIGWFYGIRYRAAHRPSKNSDRDSQVEDFRDKNVPFWKITPMFPGTTQKALREAQRRRKKRRAAPGQKVGKLTRLSFAALRKALAEISRAALLEELAQISRQCPESECDVGALKP